MARIDDANRERRDLEAYWISLIGWLAIQVGCSVDDLIDELDPNLYLSAKQKLTSDSKGRSSVPWTAIDYVDFADYSKLAFKHGTSLEKLGNPPNNWKALLSDQISRREMVRYRNHLAHSERFGMLSADEQRLALDLFVEQRRMLTDWWPNCPTSRKALRTESPYRAALKELTSDPDSSASLVVVPTSVVYRREAGGRLPMLVCGLAPV